MIKTIFLLVFLIVLGALIATPFLAIEDNPVVSNSIQFNAKEIDNAKALLRRNDPRRLEAGEMVTQWIEEDEVTLIAGYLLSQIGGGGVTVDLRPGRVFSQVSVRLPENPFGTYLNASISLSQWSSILAIDELSIGGIHVPGWLAEQIRVYGNEALKRVPEYKSAIDALNGLQIIQDRMLVAFQWRPELVDQLKRRGQDIVVDEALQERLLAYSKQIQMVAANPALGRSVSLTEFLTPLFFLAQARSGDHVQENRAALLALSFYFSGVDISRVLGVSLPEREVVSKQLTLSGRHDFAQHFLSSAALTTTATVGLADAIGMFKELDDAKGGSGFSFTDLGADRSGVGAAEFATADEASAKKFQDVMTGKLKESDFLPNFLDLPEFLPDDQFRSRYGGVGGEGYNQIAADIEKRLDQVPLYQ